MLSRILFTSLIFVLPFNVFASDYELFGEPEVLTDAEVYFLEEQTIRSTEEEIFYNQCREKVNCGEALLQGKPPRECSTKKTPWYCGCLWTASNGRKSWHWPRGITELGCDTPAQSDPGSFGTKYFYNFNPAEIG